MTVERTIQAMYDHFPGLFKDRADCYNQLFCTIGNGYEWIDGELIDTCAPVVPQHPLKDGKAYQYQKLSLRQTVEYYLRRAAARNSKPYVAPEDLEAIPDDVYHERPRKERWYFHQAGLCRDFAYLFNYPEEIKPDWKEAIEECRQMLLEDGYKL